MPNLDKLQTQSASFQQLQKLPVRELWYLRLVWIQLAQASQATSQRTQGHFTHFHP